jgi:drug/metabolite transporter (DMT)-like permease
MPESHRTRAILALLAAAFIFGATFVVVKSAVEKVDPISFVAWRFLLGAVFLSLFALPKGRAIWWHGSIAGIALFAGYALQTAGLVETSASNSALITGLYVVITPFLAALFARTAPTWWSVGAAAASFAGLILLTGNTDLHFETGDLLTVGCAFAFAFHIVALGRFARLHPVIPFTTVQLAVTAVLAFPLSWWADGVSLPPMSVWGAIVLTGIGVSALAYMLQIWAQTIVGAATAAIVVASESVFGVATGWIVLGERLDLLAWLGAALIVTSIFVVIAKQRDLSSLEAESVTPAH